MVRRCILLMAPTLLSLPPGDATAQTITAALINPGEPQVQVGMPFEVSIIATFDSRVTAVTYQLAASGTASARLTGRSAAPSGLNGLTYISLTSQDPFVSDLPVDFDEGPVTEVLVDMDYDGVPGGAADGLPSGIDVLVESVEITPLTSGSLTITLSGLSAATTEGTSDGALFAAHNISSSQVTLAVEDSGWEGHPGDTNRNWTLTIDEVTAYAACWKRGCAWSIPPNPIPIAYMTREGFLWKTGETYHRDPMQVCDAEQADCFQPGVLPAPPQATMRATSDARPLRKGSASRVILQEKESSGYRVRVKAVPPLGARVWAMEEVLPSGWRIREISDGGALDATSRRARWGPFFDTRARTLTYTVIAHRTSRTTPGSIAGLISADGCNRNVEGDTLIGESRRPDVTLAEPRSEARGEFDSETLKPLSSPLCGAGACEVLLGCCGVFLLFCYAGNGIPHSTRSSGGVQKESRGV